MAGTRQEWKVIKTDGSVEQYLHTKVFGAISNALGTAGQADTGAAEELAEAVTYYLYQQKRSQTVTSGEILSVVKAVLAATGYEDAALALSEHHFGRRLKRCRVEVVSADFDELSELASPRAQGARSRWDKSRIVKDLVSRAGVSRQQARVVAGMVEEKVFGMGPAIVTTGLLRQLVLADAAAILHAERQMQSV